MQMLADEILSPLSIKQDRRIAGLTRSGSLKMSQEHGVVIVKDANTFDRLPFGE